MAVPAVAGTPGGAATDGATLYRDNTIDVSYHQIAPGDATWSQVPAALRGRTTEGSYVARLQLENVSDHPVSKWSLTFELSDRITDTSAAKLAAPQGARTTLQGVGPTNTLQPGRTETVWYRAEPGTTADTPTWASFTEHGVSPTEDTDGDRLPDDLEVRAGLDPKSEDTDGDGLSDFAELGFRFSSPLKADTDGDGIKDGAEDPDTDGLTTARELELRTEPTNADTDGDGVQDGEETRLNTSPRAKNSAFDVTRRADGGATAAEATLKDLAAEQVGGFQVTALPAEQREFPKSTPGYLGNGFQVSAPADHAARLTFHLDPDRTEGTAPALYRYDEKARHLVKQSGQQRSGSTITATATAGSAKYVVLDSDVFDKAGPEAPGKRIPDGGDPGDPPPTDMLIHQSSFLEGHRKAPDPRHPPVPADPRVADDLTFNDYNFDELTDLGWEFWVARITPESFMWAEFNDIMNLGKLGADADHAQSVDDLRNAFRYGRGGQSAGTVTVDDNFDPGRYLYRGSGTALSRAVGASPQEKTYTDKAGQIIKQSLIDNQGRTDQLKVQEDLSKNFLFQQFYDQGVRYPVYDFSLWDANQRALSIAIHQFHGHTIALKDYKVEGNSFSGKLVFHSYDHFGLDPDDEIREYGFIDWFTLQHYDRFDGKYPPAIAQADIELPVSGTF
ncbi:DUF3289 family protein [Actinosynnema sp. NPDC047251]|uniref:DUF3289 family protein n=1 Tax=Saccharothrix espanaensis (strain ATCC 51144 / DSM 44229 / JCM 9112 / NBRC 15066 / NRRL 15764) TaxID=1179773 RepID=K0JYY9_SACES|nr:DUF3289 family protein [Saccharothrix espanaensis]CCH29473.1 hypothetical protein BN6_21510 [Saccharothrix espanaensis DSM 44229]